jgi:hypothetical protein
MKYSSKPSKILDIKDFYFLSDYLYVRIYRTNWVSVWLAVTRDVEQNSQDYLLNPIFRVISHKYSSHFIDHILHYFNQTSLYWQISTCSNIFITLYLKSNLFKYSSKDKWNVFKKSLNKGRKVIKSFF